MRIIHRLRFPLIILALTPQLTLPAGEPALESDQIVRGSDAFTMTYRAQLPTLETDARLWLPFARTDAFQTVKVKSLSTPTEWELTEDTAQGNWVMALHLSPAQSGQWIEIQYEVRRREKTVYRSDGEDVSAYLRPDRLVPRNETFHKLAAQVTEGRSGDHERGRALYRHTLERMTYDKSGEGWGRGDALYACDARAGNCTDFHAYFIALCRAIDIPARFAIGFTIPADTDSGGIEGYHCWAEFHADGAWIPVDISEAAKHPELADYYFGHHPANRLEMSVGRDLRVEPAPAAGPLNFLVYPYLESRGTSLPTRHEFTFRRRHD